MAWPTTAIVTTDMDATSDNPGNARSQIKLMADNVNAIKDAKGAANGIAELDSGGKVPTAEIPTIPANLGGTGQTAFAIGDIFYANTTSTLAKLNAGSAGTVLTSNGAGSAPSYQVAGGVPSGTRMPFNQTAAPTGWTKDTTFNDSIMRVVSGAVSNGGSNAFSTFNAQTATSAYTLATADIPPALVQLYTMTAGTASYPGSGGIGSIVENTSNSGHINTIGWLNTSNARINGGGGAHSHGMTTSIKYNDFIIAVKD